MLGFLNSFLLPALAAASLPLILHLFNKRKVKTVPFSSLRFLSRLQSQRIRQLQIYQWLLVLVRSLFILFLVLAFARPTLNATFGSGSSHTTAVVLLDDSYSMRTFKDGQTEFHRAKEYLQELLPLFDSDDALAVFTSSGKKLGRPGREIIDALEVSFKPQDWSSVLESAQKFFHKHKNLNRELYVLSDDRISRHTWPKTDSFVLQQKVKVFVLNTGVEANFQNVGIDTLYCAQQSVRAGRSFSVFAGLHNYNPHQPVETRFHLFEQNRRLAVQRIKLEAGESRELEVSINADHPGILMIKGELDDDDLDVDNQYHFVLPARKALRVLSFSLIQQPLLRAALSTLTGEQRIRLIPAAGLNLARLQPDSIDLILIAGTIAAPNSVYRVIRDLNRPVLFIPHPQTSESDLQLAVKSLTGRNLVKGLRATDQQAAYFSLEIDPVNSTLLQSVFGPNTTGKPHLKLFRYFKLLHGSQTLLRLADQNTLLEAYPLSGSSAKLYLMATAMDLSWTDMPLKGIFIPLMEQLLTHMARIPIINPSLNVSRENFWSLQSVAEANKLFLQSDASQPLPLISHPGADGLVATIPAGLKPGFYTLRNTETVVPGKVLALHADRLELQPPSVNLDSHFSDVQRLSPELNPANEVLTLRKGTELWRLFAILTLIMLFLELILVRKIEGNERTAVEST